MISAGSENFGSTLTVEVTLNKPYGIGAVIASTAKDGSLLTVHCSTRSLACLCSFAYETKLNLRIECKRRLIALDEKANDSASYGMKHSSKNYGKSESAVKHLEKLLTSTTGGRVQVLV